MGKFQTLFVTRLYQAQLSGRRNAILEETCLGLADEDRAGRRWAREHGYDGYTSYASLHDLRAHASVLGELERDIARHAARFAQDAEFDLKGRKLELDSLWINVMEQGGVHAAHIHPHAVVSGTYYVTVPRGSGAIRFEDPRLAMLMAAPPKGQRQGRPTGPLSPSVPDPACCFYGKAGCAMGSKPTAPSVPGSASASIMAKELPPLP